MINKKAQIEMPIITFIVVTIGLILFGIFIMYGVNSFLTPFSSALGNVSVQAGNNVNFVKGTFNNFWDFILIMGFVVNLILLLVTAFLIDTHPIFLVLYIVFGIVTFTFAPQVLDVLNTIYSNPTFATSVSSLQMIGFVKDYFGVIMLGVFFVTGIIMYAKFKLFGKTY